MMSIRNGAHLSLCYMETMIKASRITIRKKTMCSRSIANGGTCFHITRNTGRKYLGGRKLEKGI